MEDPVGIVSLDTYPDEHANCHGRQQNGFDEKYGPQDVSASTCDVSGDYILQFVTRGQKKGKLDEMKE